MGDANFDSFFGGGGSSSGSVVPVFRRKRAVLNRSGGYFPDGFVGNGDYIRLPTVAGGALQYYNASNTLVWSKAPAELFAGSTAWVTFALSVGSLLYCVTTDLSGGTGAVRLSTINAAGTIAQIGAGFVPSPALVTADTWEPSSNADAAGCQVVGADLAVYLTGRIITFNATTGALVSDVASRCVKGSIKLGANLFAIEFGVAGVSQLVTYRLRRDSGALGATGDVTGLGDAGAQSAYSGSNAVTPFLSWKNELVKISQCVSTPSAAEGDYTTVFDPATLAADVATLAANLRFNI